MYVLNLGWAIAKKTEGDIMVFLRINQVDKFYLLFWFDLIFCHIHDIQIVVKLAVKSSKHDQAVADKDAGMSSPGLGQRMANL